MWIVFIVVFALSIVLGVRTYATQDREGTRTHHNHHTEVSVQPEVTAAATATAAAQWQPLVVSLNVPEWYVCPWTSSGWWDAGAQGRGRKGNSSESHSSEKTERNWDGNGYHRCLKTPVVPSTVLAAEVRNGLWGTNDDDDDTLLRGLHLRQVVDLSSEGGALHYTRAFVLPSPPTRVWNWFRRQDHDRRRLQDQDHDRRFFLLLDGVQFTADVVVWGRSYPECRVQGMFATGVCEITDAVTNANTNTSTSTRTTTTTTTPPGVPFLVVVVTPPPHPGTVDGEGQGQGGDHEYARNGPVAQFAAGWDWIRPTPDRHTGLWNGLRIRTTGPVAIVDSTLTVRPRVLRIKTSSSSSSSSLSSTHGDATVEVQGHVDVPVIRSTSHHSVEEVGTRTGTLTVTFAVRQMDGTEVAFGEQELLPTSTSTSNTPTMVPVLFHWCSGELSNVRLWWPHTWGTPVLYVIEVRLYYRGHLSDSRDFKVGFRSVHLEVMSMDHRKNGNETENDTGNDNNNDKNNNNNNNSNNNNGMHPKGSPVVVLNGRRVFLTGGNWITTDQLLRYTHDEDEDEDKGKSQSKSKSKSNARSYRHHVRLHKRHLGVDLLRVWGGGIAEREQFYQVCDEEGVLVWQEFWLTGDNNGRWGGTGPGWPDGLDNQSHYHHHHNHSDNHHHNGTTADLFVSNAADVVGRLHVHPSLILWGLGNEITDTAGSQWDLQNRLVRLLEDRYYDSTTTTGKKTKTNKSSFILFHTSMGNWTHYDPLRQATPKDGNYGVLSDHEWYTRNPGMYDYVNGTNVRVGPVGGNYAWYDQASFNPEQGSSAVPVHRSLQQLFNNDDNNNKDNDDNKDKDEWGKGFPTNSNETDVGIEWTYHNYQSWRDEQGQHWIYDVLGGRTSSSDHDHHHNHITNASEFSAYANLAHYYQTKLLWESHLFRAMTWYTAILYWKSQSPWPSLRGFLYDWNLRHTGGGWATSHTLQRSVHFLLAPPSPSPDHPTLLAVVNRRLHPYHFLPSEDVRVERIRIPCCQTGCGYSRPRTTSTTVWPLSDNDHVNVTVTVPPMSVKYFHLSTTSTSTTTTTINEQDGDKKNHNYIHNNNNNDDNRDADLTRIRVGGTIVNEYLSTRYRSQLGRFRARPDRPRLHVVASPTQTDGHGKDDGNGNGNGGQSHVGCRVTVSLVPSSRNRERHEVNEATTIVTAIHVSAIWDANGNEILPFYCQRGYFSLLPEESTTFGCHVDVEVDVDDNHNQNNDGQDGAEWFPFRPTNQRQQHHQQHTLIHRVEVSAFNAYTETVDVVDVSMNSHSHSHNHHHNDSMATQQ